MLPGGDYGFAWNPIGTNARDLEHFVKLLDFTPMQAIVACAPHGGELMGLAGQLGQVREGWLADLMLVDGDPLKDIAMLQDADRLARHHEGRRLPQAPAKRRRRQRRGRRVT